jgi:hypothetical protein
MNYKKLKEWLKNTDISDTKRLILRGYIDYCENNHVSIENVIFTLNTKYECLDLGILKP